MPNRYYKYLIFLFLFITVPAFADTIVSSDITSNTTWTLTGSPYIIAVDVNVRNGAVLTIEPGVQVKFESQKGLYIGYSQTGGLFAQGATDNPVIFTSNQTTPTAGDWKAIYFGSGTILASTRMEYCVVEYGGYLDNANIYINNTSPTITNSTVTNSSGVGIYVASGFPVLANNSLNNNATYPISTDPNSCSNFGTNTAFDNG
ncbi:MAG TPA: hypothetical protein PL155_04915, partial [Candidatus Omnitrophota bacterium]|nr:hypothetical protein [Candidatus Omnitrophota bacterium]HPD84180.1 hypothetical protein [Candidatus Omnitrophota bacterium]